MTVLVVALWGSPTRLELGGRAGWAITLGRALTVALVIHVLVIGPWWHRDGAASRVLGNPRQVWTAVHRRPWWWIPGLLPVTTR